MKLKTNSWHYKLNKMAWDRFRPYDYTDFCSYFWITVFGVIKIGLIAAAVLFSTFVFTILWKITLVILGAVVGVLLCVGAYFFTKEVMDHTKPGFFRNSWRALRDKTCHKLEWE